VSRTEVSFACGPVGLLTATYRIWRRLPEARKREIKSLPERSLAGRALIARVVEFDRNV
jgi:hypothetical protein